jgi:hypothetical protein
MPCRLAIHQSVPIDTVPRVDEQQVNAPPPSLLLQPNDERVKVWYTVDQLVGLCLVELLLTSPVSTEARLLSLMAHEPAMAVRAS